MEKLLEFLENNDFKITIENNEYTIYYKNIELLILQIEKDLKKIEFFREDLLEDKNINFENIQKYLDNAKKIINDKEIEEKKRDKEVEKDTIGNKIEIYKEDDFIVREVPQPVGFLTLMEYLDRNIIEIPKNQRNYVWTKEQVENLAISLLKGYPIPPLYGYRNEKNQLVILDGQQRLISMYLYYKDKYLKSTSNMPIIDLRKILCSDNKMEEGLLEELNKTYKIRDQRYFLKKIEKESKNEITKEITYGQLSPEVKRVLDFRTLNIIEILVIGNEDINKEDIYFRVFGNLNQGGTQLKAQELRNGIYSCAFYQMLHDINNNNEIWRRVFGPKHKHSRDVEFLLRFCAVKYCFSFEKGEVDLDYLHNKEKDKIRKFEGSFPRLLNDFSKLSLKFTTNEINEFKLSIERFLEKLDGDKNNTYNTLLESLYFASSHLPGSYKISGEFLEKLSRSDEYRKFVSSSSSSRKNVKERLEYVYKQLKEKYGDANE